MSKQLNRLAQERIVNITTYPENPGLFSFQEACDYYFNLDLTADEVLELAAELIAMVKEYSK